MTNDYEYLRDASHTFEDGVKLNVISLKLRETEYWIIYESVYPGALPKRTSVKAREFLDTYGHLFQKS